MLLKGLKDSSDMFVENKVEKLELSDKLTSKLKSNNIFIIKDLWQMKRKDLKNLGFTDNEIGQIIIKLQLRGLDLSGRTY